MGHIVILEGPDGAGKSTLARKLENVGYKYMHIGPPEPKEDLLDTYASFLYLAHFSPRNHVFDRLHLGECVYGPLLRGKDKLGLEGVKLLTRLINAYAADLVVCLPPYLTARAKWASKGDELIKEEGQYARIYNAYENILASKLYGRPQIFDWTLFQDLGSLFIVNLVEKGLSRKELPEGVIGSKTPKFLFVGDRVNHNSLDVPFMSLGNSSHYLNEAITLAGYPESEIAFMNSFMVDGRLFNVGEAWKKLDRPKLIVLGTLAKTILQNENPNLVNGDNCIPHPAYWKRFHSSKREEYVKLLRKLREPEWLT